MLCRLSPGRDGGQGGGLGVCSDTLRSKYVGDTDVRTFGGNCVF